MVIKKTTECKVCGGSDLEILFEWPSFPLTGLFYKNKDQIFKDNHFDQTFLLCRKCKHGQLGNILPQQLIYNDTYTHRTAASTMSRNCNDSFYNNFKDKLGKKKYKSILEIGCNDLYLLKKISNHGVFTVGTDPIWKGREHNLSSNIKILGKFIDELNLERDFDQPPDLIYSSHTFEHIENVFESVKSLFDMASEGCDFFIEVPSLDSLIKTLRFDQIFHQHINYFSEQSMLYLINRVGGTYVDHYYNYDLWGGTLCFIFKKNRASEWPIQKKVADLDVVTIKNFYSFFYERMHRIPKVINYLSEDIYGFGAAQMLPTLAYHMGSDLSFLKCILDDNSDRWENYLPGISAVIKSADLMHDISNAAVLITALDSTLPIVNRLSSFKPRRIISPAFFL